MEKKIMSVVMSIVMLFGMAFSFVGCDIENFFIEDGDFLYYNLKNTYMKEDGYAIVGSTEQGKEYKEDVYVPAYFKGKEITRTCFREYGTYGGVKSYVLAVNCKNLYFNYIQKYPTFVGTAEYMFVPESTEAMSRDIFVYVYYTSARTAYVGRLTYAYMKETILSSQKVDSFNETNGYILSHYDYGSRQYSIILANTSYMFNYENSPNNDYFFINNFENGALIENTPYEPLREGYKFDGWYKEPECIHAWNFNEDRLPKFEYDSNGYITNFEETKLYAKWIEN